MSVSRYLRGLTISVALALGLVSTPDQSALAATCKGAPEQSGEIIMLADWLVWAQQGPMVSAQINGLYKKAGLNIKIIAPANPSIRPRTRAVVTRSRRTKIANALANKGEVKASALTLASGISNNP